MGSVCTLLIGKKLMGMKYDDVATRNIKRSAEVMLNSRLRNSENNTTEITFTATIKK